MECHEVKIWMVAEDRWTDQNAENAYRHMAACATCKKLFDLNDLVEMQAGAALEQVNPAPDLLSRIKKEIQTIETKRFNPMGPYAFRRFAPALAAAAIFILLILNPFSAQIGSLGEIGSYALANHIDTEMSMAFRSGQINDVPAWFSKRLGFPITIPVFETRRFKFLGGRECNLGKKKAAYLYYDKQGEKVSLFIINYRDLNFPLSQQKTYTVYDQGYEIKVWIQGKLCYTLVQKASVIA
jgi:hypothetical protein